MLRYIKAAFFLRVPVPALGQVPVNLLGVVGLGILGFAEPTFWLLGVGLETALLFLLATNPRFQKLVEAADVRLDENDAEQKRRLLITTLPAESQQRLLRLSAKCRQVSEIFRNQQADEFVLEANRDALWRLEWVYLKLLVAEHNLLSTKSAETEVDLQKRIELLTAGNKDASDSDSLRQSRTATINILRERLANIARRAQSTEEVESDLTRIEAQLDLMIENAIIQGKPQTIATDIELATNLAGASIFGESQSAVSDLDHAFGAPLAKTTGTTEAQ